MKIYDKFYNKTIDLIKSGNLFPTLEEVCESNFPASDFSNKAIKEINKAIIDASLKSYLKYQEAHPRHVQAVLRGVTTEECLKIYLEEGGSNYLHELEYI